jgi:Na+/proline symporter
MNSASDVSRRHRWIVAVVFTVGLVMAAERGVTIEWSSAYCSNPYDGPASAVFGAPFPYERWSGASSLLYVFVPRLYVLNILILFGIALPVVRWTAERLARRSSRAVYRALAIGGVLLCGLMAARHALGIGLWQPVASIVSPPYESYEGLRPVGVSLGRHYDCTPSEFWFSHSGK